MHVFIDSLIHSSRNQTRSCNAHQETLSSTLALGQTATKKVSTVTRTGEVFSPFLTQKYIFGREFRQVSHPSSSTLPRSDYFSLPSAISLSDVSISIGNERKCHAVLPLRGNHGREALNILGGRISPKAYKGFQLAIAPSVNKPQYWEYPDATLILKNRTRICMKSCQESWRYTSN